MSVVVLEVETESGAQAPSRYGDPSTRWQESQPVWMKKPLLVLTCPKGRQTLP